MLQLLLFSICYLLISAMCIQPHLINGEYILSKDNRYHPITIKQIIERDVDKHPHLVFILVTIWIVTYGLMIVGLFTLLS